MRVLRMRTLNSGALAVLSVALLCTTVALPPTEATQVAAPEIVLTLDPVQTKVHWTLDSTLHTVHGTFALKGGTVHFDPETGKAGGEIVVDAPSGDSGNGSRDKRMHKEILETAKYPEVVFRPTQVEGKVGQSGASDVKLAGVFSIHGADHEFTAPVHAVLTAGRWRGTSEFEVPYVEWGIKDPSNFLLKVKPVVKVELEMSGEVRARPENPTDDRTGR
jgi:polyisoprenoid-binding protein YceI